MRARSGHGRCVTGRASNTEPQVEIGPSAFERRRRDAAERRARRHGRLLVRPSRPYDALPLRRLAALERRLLPGGDFLVAELGGVLVAAVALDADARPFRDPSRPTADICSLLALRIRGLSTSLREAA
jgi:hypothetical protein